MCGPGGDSTNTGATGPTGPSAPLEVAAAFVLFNAGTNTIPFVSQYNFAGLTRLSPGNYHLTLAPVIPSSGNCVAVITPFINNRVAHTQVVGGGPGIAVVEAFFNDLAGTPQDASFYVHVDILP